MSAPAASRPPTRTTITTVAAPSTLAAPAATAQARPGPHVPLA